MWRTKGLERGSVDRCGTYVDSVALDGSEDHLSGELMLKVADDHGLSSQLECLLLYRLPVFFLADIGKEGLYHG